MCVLSSDGWFDSVGRAVVGNLGVNKGTQMSSCTQNLAESTSPSNDRPNFFFRIKCLR
jgi:hypothetical protein